MSECSHNVPCPSFEEVTLTVDGVCDCQHFFWPGNPECPVHGDRIAETVNGWEAAVQALKTSVAAVRAIVRDEDSHTQDWNYGWRTAIQSFNAAMGSIHQAMPTPAEHK